MTNTSAVYSDPVRATRRGAFALEGAMCALRRQGIFVELVCIQRPGLLARGVYVIAFTGSISEATVVDAMVNDLIESLRVSS